MNEQEALAKMVPPSQWRPTSFRGGIIQINITHSCDKACSYCTQGSNLSVARGYPTRMTVEQFEQACISLEEYFGVVGVFGGNPAIHPDFEEMCAVLRRHIPQERCGLWCNKPFGKGKAMAKTFNPAYSNLNTHLDIDAYNEFKRDWPESNPFGQSEDSRHSPVYISMQDLGVSEEKRWELISQCDINQHWSAMIGVFRGELRGYFCEIAGAMSRLHQNNLDFPDVGVEVTKDWWKLPMEAFKDQVRKCCHNCGVPLKAYGALAQGQHVSEQVTKTHLPIYSTKSGIAPTLLTEDSLQDLQTNTLGRMTDYLGNSHQ